MQVAVSCLRRRPTSKREGDKMKTTRLLTVIGVAGALVFAGILSCGGGGGAVLIITPAGPVVVKKGATQQFTANLGGVTWSVEGGDPNGTIDANGLYTPPAILPLGPSVTVKAVQGGQTATALVNLRTADTVAFAPSATNPRQVNTTPIPGTTFSVTFVQGGVSDRLAVSLGSLHANAAWVQGTGGVEDIFFNQAVDFGAFGTERNLSVSAADLQVPLTVENDANQNPLILFTDTPTPAGSKAQLMFMRSTDQGATFGTPVPVHSNPAQSQDGGMFAQDDKGNLHAIFTEGDGTPVGGVKGGTVFYSQSTDNGDHWSTPVPVATPAMSHVQILPYLSVNPGGDTVYVCWSEIPDSSNPSTADVFVAKSANGGANFSLPVNASNSPTTASLLCRTALGPNGEIFMAYTLQDISNSDTNILFVASTDGGATFTNPPKTVNSDTANTQAFSFLSVDSLGRIDVVWSSDTNADDNADSLMYSRSTDGGQNFSPNVAIADGGATTFILGCGLRHDDSGRLHIFYATDVNDPGNNIDLFYLTGE
jgi:hypothetical protein